MGRRREEAIWISARRCNRKCLIGRAVDRSNMGLAGEAVGSASLLGIGNFSALSKRAEAAIRP